MLPPCVSLYAVKYSEYGLQNREDDEGVECECRDLAEVVETSQKREAFFERFQDFSDAHLSNAWD